MNVTLLVCDDIRIELNGKIFIIGMYPGNISIPEEDYLISQLQFIFTLSDAIDKIPRDVLFEIQLPGVGVIQSNIAPEIGFEPQHTTWTLRHALAAVSQPLRSGKIIARVIADGEEHLAASPWIQIVRPAAEAEASPSHS